MSFIVQPGQVQWSQSQMAVSLGEYCHFSQLSRYSASVNIYSQHIVVTLVSCCQVALVDNFALETFLN